jgi:hypothetical protein
LGFRKSKDGAVKADDNNTPTEQLNSWEKSYSVENI